MAVIAPARSNEARYAENLERHLERVDEVRSRLYDLDQQIESGNYTVETLNEFSKAYEEYLDIRTGKNFSEGRGVLRRLLSRGK